MSTREQIVAGVVAALTGLAVNAAAVPVYRSREEAFARGDLPAVVVRPSEEETQALSEEQEVSYFNIHLEVIVRGSPWDVIADPVIVEAHRMMLGNSTLMGLVLKMRRTAAKWDAHDADQTAGVLTQTYRVIYAAPTNQL